MRASVRAHDLGDFNLDVPMEASWEAMVEGTWKFHTA